MADMQVLFPKNYSDVHNMHSAFFSVLVMLKGGAFNASEILLVFVA